MLKRLGNEELTMKHNRKSIVRENFANDSEYPSIDNVLRQCYLENKIVEEFLTRQSLSEKNSSSE